MIQRRRKNRNSPGFDDNPVPDEPTARARFGDGRQVFEFGRGAGAGGP